MLHTTAYATPDDVAELLGMIDPITFEPMTFTNETYHTYDWIQKRLLVASDDFDARTHDTWRINQVKDHIFNRGTLWHLDNMAFYGTPYMNGGWSSQLIGPIINWDPEQGDKLEYRTFNNTWTDITDMVNKTFWFDYEGGVFFNNYNAIPVENAFRITYRYGRDTTPPYDIQDAVCKTVAIYVIQSDWYRTRIGGGGDLQSRSETIRQWNEDIRQTIYAHLNCGEAVSILQ